MISRGRKYRIAIGLIAGWAMAVLVPGVVAGLVVYQVNVRRIDSVVPTLVSGVRAEVTVVDAEVVHITPVMRATIMVASDEGGGGDKGLGYAAEAAGGSGMGTVPLHESATSTLPAHTGAESGTARSAASIGSPFGAGVYLPIQPTEGASSLVTPHDPFTGTATETMTPMPLAIEKDEPVIEPLPTPTLAATEASTPIPESTPTLAATETLQPTIAPVDTWTPAPTFEPTPTITVSPVPIVIPTETATASPLESPLATPTSLPSATPVETETPIL